MHSRTFLLALLSGYCLSISLVASEEVSLHSSAVAATTNFADRNEESMPESKESQGRKEDSLSDFRGKSPLEIFEGGNQAFEDGEYLTAVQSYQALNSLYPFSQYAEEAWFYTIKASYKQALSSSEKIRMDDMFSVATKFLNLYPSSEYKEEVYKLMGTIHFDDRDGVLKFIHRCFGNIDFSKHIDPVKLAEAEFHLKNYLEHYPSGMYREEIETMRYEIKCLLAKYEYHAAQSCFDNRQYVGARHHIEKLLRDYPKAKEMIGEEYAGRLDKIDLNSKRKLALCDQYVDLN